MSIYILPLADPYATLETVGGKGLSLAKMLNAGLPVPDGFHITTASYRQFIADNHLQAPIMAALQDANPADMNQLEAASAAIFQLFQNGIISSKMETDIRSAYARLENAPVAVRSSATAEDLPDASFAGQQETYLNIHGVEAVLAAVKQCWASLWTARAIAYRIKQNIDQEQIALAVVVQQLVFADAAGILFTANPVNGSRAEMVINAAWGLGEAVVSGAVTPDTITVQKPSGKILVQDIAEKLVMTIRTEQGTCEEPVPVEKRGKPALSKVQIRDLTRLGTQIEQFYGMPMDVEWTRTGNTFAIVQARPITTLPIEWKPPVPKALYSRGSLAEHTPSPVTPLFATLGLEIINIATTRMWEKYIGKDCNHFFVDKGFYTTLHGYVYGGISMKGLDFLELTRMSLAVAKEIYRDSVGRWKQYREQFIRVVEEEEKKSISNLSAAELLESVYTVFGAACQYFTDIQTCLPAASNSEVVFARYYSSLVRRKQDPPPTTFLLGFETSSLRAEKSLYDLAHWVQESPSLSDYLRSLSTSETDILFTSDNCHADIPPAVWQEWCTRFQQHLNLFGKTAYEFDFANPTGMETPRIFIDAICAFLNGKACNPYQRQQDAINKREQAVQIVTGHIHGPIKKWFFQLLHWAQETNPMREDSIFDMGLGHFRIRQILAELGQRLTNGNAIPSAEDIYWLEKVELEECIAALDANRPLPGLTDRIPARKREWHARLKITPPLMVPQKTGWEKMMHGKEAEKKNGKTVLRGIGTSSGTITAPACILYGPEDFSKFRSGDVLVAVTTTPAWTPLFALASAVVTDIGGPLSHSSIVAREYGIPAVMAARSATRMIQPGQMITVDGSAGTVILE